MRQTELSGLDGNITGESVCQAQKHRFGGSQSVPGSLLIAGDTAIVFRHSEEDASMLGVKFIYNAKGRRTGVYIRNLP